LIKINTFPFANQLAQGLLSPEKIGIDIKGNSQLNRTSQIVNRDLSAISEDQSTSPSKLLISLERKLKELTVLYQISQAIGSTFNCQKVFSDILAIFHSHLGMNRGTITCLDPIQSLQQGFKKLYSLFSRTE
jgi:hypothetical protein